MKKRAVGHHATGRNSDYLIINRRREEEQRTKMTETTQYYKTTLLASAFEEHTGMRIKNNQISRRLDEMKGRLAEQLEERRERLRTLIATDNERYSQELLDSEETRETVLAGMRARMEELKAKRETERKKIVEEKLLQRWRNECDDLRKIQSKVLEKKVAIARGDQLNEHQRKKEQELEEKRFYEYLWEQDRQKKIAREVAEKTKLSQMNAITVAMLDNQMDLLRQQQAREDQLKQEEALLMRQETEMRKLEDERNIRRKEEHQRLVRLELDKFNSLRLQARANEAKLALEEDLKFVNAVLALDESEKQDRNQRRAELRKEMQIFRAHLMELRQFEKDRDDEILRMEKVEADKLWTQRAEKWQKEQRARDKLLVEVLEGRKNQLLQTIERNRKEQEEVRLEREQILHQIEIANRVEALDKQRKDTLAQSYRESLEAQIETVEERKREARRLDKREELAMKLREQKYSELLAIETDLAWERPR
ncbi:Cilia- and flagella-associated protein 53 [Physocladia obscura]|uniref:Cilia- and flagella-associated protein 53 n=1 Tax=Physocladia obscura TaxID=109957 RepID=A0AAD5T2U3_9FUNG|nr:Cilia- and flagella-associated protein 53 [Physocladia obscura]